MAGNLNNPSFKYLEEKHPDIRDHSEEASNEEQVSIFPDV